MNYPDTYPPNTSHRNSRPGGRPATIAELLERANIPWDGSKEFKYYLRLAEKCRRDGQSYEKSGNMENAFVELAKAATVAFEMLPAHPQYNTLLTPVQRHNLGLNGLDIFNTLTGLQSDIVDRYEKWRQAHPDEDSTVRNQQRASDNATRAKTQRESQIRDDESARAIPQLTEQDSIVVNGAHRWVQWRQQLTEEKRSIISEHSMNLHNNREFTTHSESEPFLGDPYHIPSTSTTSLSASSNPPSATPSPTAPTRVTIVPIIKKPEGTEVGLNIVQTPGAKINIHGGTFLNIAGNSTHITNPPSSDERGLEILRQGIESDAMHDSAKRYPPPKCHPDTRTSILEEIKGWINHIETQYPVFWLHARAGEGKSAIMQFIAELMLIPKGNVAATFFFGRGMGKREQARYLFSTLAYQLALNIPALRHSIEKIMRKKPTLPSSSMDVQVQHLFFDGFSELEDQPRVPWTILIDGLDECNSPDDQQSILGLIAEIITFHGLQDP